MKRAVIALLVLAILTSACIAMALMLRLRVASIGQQILDVEEAVVRQDYAGAEAAYRQLYEGLREIEPMMLFLTGRKHVGSIPPYLARIGGYLTQQENSDLLVELSEFQAYLEHIWDSHALRFENLL